MQAYKTLIKERLPVVPNLILAAGLMLSAYGLANSDLTAMASVFGAAALFAFVSELRFMDELKDVEKDIVANPDRPLPRGAITKEQTGKLIGWTGALLAAFSVASAFIFSPVSGVLLGVSVVWLYLMYREFFVGDWLAARPLLYAISHQIVIFPLCLFALSLHNPAAALSAHSLAFGALILSAFFTFEVGRKLDPSAHEILKTYLVEYGPKTVIVFLIVLQSIAVASAYVLGILWWVSPFAVLIFLSLPKLISKPNDYKNLEGLIALNLIYVVWVVAIKTFASSL